jgi:Na+(H+)/acetate symporter ActP
MRAGDEWRKLTTGLGCLYQRRGDSLTLSATAALATLLTAATALAAALLTATALTTLLTTLATLLATLITFVSHDLSSCHETS